MPQQYNQTRAMLAITRASFRAMLRSPSAVIFSIFFPLIFILVFGFIGNTGGMTYRIVIAPGSNTSNAFIDSLQKIRNVKLVSFNSEEELESELIKGRLTAVVAVETMKSVGIMPSYAVHIQSTTASSDKIYSFLPLVENIISKIDRARFGQQQSYARIVPEIRQVRKYRTIDFILPGQLGFSLLSAGVFGVAFLFFSLRQQLVLKRFFATPIRRGYIVMGEGLARVIFQLLTALIIVGIGHYAFQFTLVHGWLTFLEIIVLSFIALLVFMGFGFIISGIAKSESSIPPIANIFTLPQFLLAGTFFSIDAFPAWLQPISRALPLTYFNDAMRRIAFEGDHLGDCLLEIGVLVLWGVIGYAIAIKVFRWE
jgi:ABC-2 type transport system permease protein